MATNVTLTRKEFWDVRNTLLNSGYEYYLSAVDDRVADEATCPECGSDRVYASGLARGRLEYRVFIVCPEIECGAVLEI